MQPFCQVQSPSAPNEPTQSTDVEIVLKSQDFYDDSFTLIGPCLIVTCLQKAGVVSSLQKKKNQRESKVPYSHLIWSLISWLLTSPKLMMSYMHRIMLHLRLYLLWEKPQHEAQPARGLLEMMEITSRQQAASRQRFVMLRSHICFAWTIYCKY